VAQARPANASGEARLIFLVRALLLSSERKKRIYQCIAQALPLGLNATALALFVSSKLEISEPTARRAVKKMLSLRLAEAERGAPVFLTPLGEKIFGGGF